VWILWKVRRRFSANFKYRSRQLSTECMFSKLLSKEEKERCYILVPTGISGFLGIQQR
jgi:hypothetical protein